MKILCIIPARGGSKGIPYKNVKLLNGKPLLAYTAESAKNSRFINRIVLTTDDKNIFDLGIKLGIEVPFLRASYLAKDDTPSLPVFENTLLELYKIDSYKPDIIIILQPTSPLRTSKHIDEALELFIATKCDSLVSICDVPHNMNPYSIMKLNKNNLLERFLEFDENSNLRQKKPKFVARTGAAIYIFNYDCLMKKKSIYGDSIIGYKMDKISSIDIDDEIDWEIASHFITKRTHHYVD
jgi:N-acylneuraminate cytidylyltransferase/CMP-N,N'-diacetyllegionaminic acid synthase